MAHTINFNDFTTGAVSGRKYYKCEVTHACGHTTEMRLESAHEAEYQSSLPCEACRTPKPIDGEWFDSQFEANLDQLCKGTDRYAGGD